MKNWKLPSLILVLLIIAMIFRWNVVNVSVAPGAVGEIRYQIDNWNGSIIEKRYVPSIPNTGYAEIIAKPPFMWIWSKYLTATWGIFTSGSIIWLLYAVSKTNKESKKNSINI